MQRLFPSLPYVLLFFALLTLAPLTAEAQPALDKRLVADGLSAPVYVTSPPNDYSRLFIVERGGTIKIVRNDTLLSRPFLDLTSDISGSGEQGLLGMAFHPNYESNGYFFINHTGLDGDTRIERISVSSDPDSADVATRATILTVSQPFANHNAGMLAFGPSDGYLYIGLGDGGSSDDPGNRAQDPTTLLGKMLRIDVDGGTPYAIPPDNPFVGTVDTLPEIWAIGLRNPWRYSFDRQTSDLYIADVGQNSWEEVNVQPSTSSGGENYGWRLKEGTGCYIPSTNCEAGVTLTDPVVEYDHGGTPFRCSVTGGFVYRGCAMPDLAGHYFYADYCAGRIWSFKYDNGTATDSTEWTSQLQTSGVRITSFGQDAAGELYIVTFTGSAVYKIIPASGEVDCPDIACCTGQRGDMNGDGTDANPTDLAYLVDYLFAAGSAPVCAEEADIDGVDGAGDPTDLAYLVDYLFSGGPAPVSCP